MKNAIFTLLALIFMFFHNGVAMAAKAKADILIESLERVTATPDEVLLPGDGIVISAKDQLQDYLPAVQIHDFNNSNMSEIGLFLGEYIAELIGDDPLKALIDNGSYYALFTTYSVGNKRTLVVKYDQARSHVVSQCMNAVRHSLVQVNTSATIDLLTQPGTGSGDKGKITAEVYQVSDVSNYSKTGDMYIANKIIKCFNY